MNANERTTISLAAGLVLTLDVAAGATGTITRLSDSVGGEPYSPVAISGADLSFGPYNATRRYEIELSVGSLSYSVEVADPADKADTGDYAATAAIVNTLAALHLYGAGVPVDYTDGSPPATGEGVAPKGALYSDTTNGSVYRNSGTQAEPIWTALGDAA